MLFFRSSLYWGIMTPFFYLMLAFFLFITLNACFKTLKNRSKLWLLLIPLFFFLPLGISYGPNVFMHMGFANALAENPLTYTYCLHFAQEKCLLNSMIPWSPTYHILLSRFILFGDSGIALMNSGLLFISVYFFALTLKENKINELFAFLLLSPQILHFLRTPTLELLSLANFTVFYYFLLKKEKAPALISAMSFIHIRAENFVLLIFFLPKLLPLIEGTASWVFFGINSIIKGAEFYKGWFYSPEWTPPLIEFLNKLSQNLTASTMFLIDPTKSNFLWFVLVILGAFFAFRKNKALIIAPLLSIFIHITHQEGVNFYTNPYRQRVILQIIAISIPLVVVALKRIKPRKEILLLILVPLLFMDFSSNELAKTYFDLLSQKDTIIEVSNNLSMPIISYSPWVFKEGESVVISDSPAYPPGSYLFPNSQPIKFTNTKEIKIKYLNITVGELYLYNWTYYG